MNHQKGFTLVEAAVAIGVVTTLSGIIIPLAMKSLRSAQYARAKNDLQVIAAALAKQLQDTGGRPTAGVGPGGSTGALDAIWYSGGDIPAVAAGVGMIAVGAAGANTFDNLFTAPNNNPVGGGAATTLQEGNTLFGLGVINGVNDLNYRGPYLASDMALKSDPWGTAYLVLGYNANGTANHGPIWVVCAGQGKAIDPGNLTPPVGANGQYPSTWAYGVGASEHNLAIRIQ